MIIINIIKKSKTAVDELLLLLDKPFIGRWTHGEKGIDFRERFDVLTNLHDKAGAKATSIDDGFSAKDGNERITVCPKMYTKCRPHIDHKRDCFDERNTVRFVYSNLNN